MKSVALLGCGSIGSLYDENSPESDLTHAGALALMEGVELVAVCDRDSMRADSCGVNRGVAAYYDLADLLENHQIDILCIAAPPEDRAEQISRAIDSGVRALLVEKPLALNLATAEKIADFQSRVPIAVNYLRSWSTSLSNAMEWYRSRRIGEIRRIEVRYDKGLINNGTHALDLVRHFVGWPNDVSHAEAISDGRETDPTVSAIFHAERNIPIHFLGSDYRDFSIFEIDILGSAGRIRFEDKCRSVSLEILGKDPDYPSFAMLEDSKSVAAGLDGSIRAALTDLVQLLDGEDTALRCDATDALRTLKSAYLAIDKL